jgi:hypothetical protein
MAVWADTEAEHTYALALFPTLKDALPEQGPWCGIIPGEVSYPGWGSADFAALTALRVGVAVGIVPKETYKALLKRCDLVSFQQATQRLEQWERNQGLN